MPPLSPTDLERFWSKVKKSDGCWEWQGTLVAGYGKITIGGRSGFQWIAHRLSWTMENGDIPDGLCCCHKCDNRKCVRPSHLFLGSNADNQEDSRRKGRAYVIPPRVGTLNCKCKLDDDKVRAIREMFKGGLSSPKIGKIFGVTRKNVMFIVNRKTWPHVN